MKCKNCKYYVCGYYLDEFTGPVLQETNDITDGKCLNPKIDSDEFQKDGLQTSDYDDRSVLKVGPDFGCIHFEKIE